MSNPMPLSSGVLTSRTVVINDPELRMCYAVTVPANSDEDAWRFLLTVGSGGITGTGIQNSYLGTALPSIRRSYYDALARVEKEIAAKRAQMGPRLNDPAQLRSFTEWASSKRTTIARLWRIPAGPGGMLGGEIRDLRQYGVGGRSLENLVRRAEAKGFQGDAALLKVLGSVDKPNPGATQAILRGARHLRSAGAVLFVGGAALTAYNIASAPAGQRRQVAKQEGVGLAGGIVGSNLAVGVCFLLGMTGVGLVVVGVVAGVAGAVAAERIYFAHDSSQAVKQLRSGDVADLRLFSPLPAVR